MAILASVTVVYSTASVSVSTTSASAEVSFASADTSYELPEASVSYQDIQSVYTYDLPVADIAWIDLLAAIEIDDSGRYKIILDTAVVVEDAVWELMKAVFDTAYAVDSAALSLSKPAADSVSVDEQISKSPAKTFRELFHTSEHVQEFIVGKNVFDQALTNDVLRADIEKQLSDGVAINDLVGIPDGITFSAVKVVANIVSTSDIHTFDTSLGKSDSVNPLDTLALSSVKPLTDTVDAIDDYAIIFAKKVVADTSTILEELAIEFERGIEQDNVVVAEQIAMDYATAKFETLTVDDSNTLDISKSKQDYISTYHMLSYSLAKTALDQVFVADSQIIYTSKGLQDTSSASDSGVLQMQDYCDITYFLEDYVGVSRSF